VKSETGLCDTLRIGNGVILALLVVVVVAVLELVYDEWISELGTTTCVVRLLFPGAPDSEDFELRACPSFFPESAFD
jgi:hypothetical protein